MKLHQRIIPDDTLEASFSTVPNDFDSDDLAAALNAHGVVDDRYMVATRYLQNLRKNGRVIKHGSDKGRGARWLKAGF